MSTPRQTSYRRLVFWIFLIFFGPLAAVIIIYSAGYRYLPETSTFVPSAALSVETTPKKAQVFLDQKLQQKNTPLFADLISPGKHTVTITKDGYYSWSKTVLFAAGKSTIFSGVILWKKSNPQPQKTANTDKDYANFLSSRAMWQLLPQNLYEYYRQRGFSNPELLQYLNINDGRQVLVADPLQQNAFLVSRLDEWSDAPKFYGQITSASWSKDNHLLLATNHELRIFDPTTNQTTLLLRQTANILDVSWHPNGDYLFYSDQNSLFVMELDNRDQKQQWPLLTLPNITDIFILPKGDKLFFQSQGQTYNLELYS